MIYRSRAAVGHPAVLGPVGTRAAREREAANAYYSAHPAPTKSMEFKVYSDDRVKELLNDLFGKKCAYCEGRYAGMMPVDVEHFRPKGEIVDSAGQRYFPGYWFLASTWTNLLPSCIDCNRARWHEIDDEAHKFGKENRFPLAAGGVYATSLAQLAAEPILLIDPTNRDPSHHMRFVCKGGMGGRLESVVEPLVVGGASDAYGVASINTFGLNRPDLANERRLQLQRLELALDNVAYLYEMASEELLLERRTAIKSRAKDFLRRAVVTYLHWKAPYSTACRAFYREWVSRLNAPPAGDRGV